ncbi:MULTISPECIES: mannose-1-phosphate guanylyltransferase [Myroides]|uniref:mannose-1-phosphate guanylyltransferase n=1 Tax=Myroides albus TaxID=2562892 RepID=A0A6I3LJA3_9FLAO|nr:MULTISPECIES: mannose-1-phosphate guanylyltransferase [Myroides]MTG97270.1 mannose-1-phosphate guanylyltransferase [Myroides albus]MVX34289.1 mannose-1-phosphate guanylyltransferase [Myroides sp. LoEW2-1]UVD80642.1 mannose-1-phosphate guanylyltransferase [Myroides albus]
MSSNYYAVVMAGGVGSRFWPVSTPDFPKQFHDMLGTGDTLIQKTFKRLSLLIPKENILILTHENYRDIVREQLPSVELENIILEPAMRNTAPCILYAAMKIKKINPDAVMVVAPSDHWIEDEVQFISNLQRTFDVCERDRVLMTLGILPTFPNTGYGYIEFNKLDSRPIKKVVQFREKPDYVTARKFIQSRHFLWNAGIFVWSVQAIIEAFSEFQPKMIELFNKGNDLYNTNGEKSFINEHYPLAENISIDYAIMEKANNVYVLPATFDWNDLGTWGSLYDKLPKDCSENAVVNAKAFFNNATNNIVRTDSDKLVVVDGLSDYIIVDKEGVLLIYPKKKEQEIKTVSHYIEDKLKEENK